mgnify:CR=1 FL=1
MSLSASSPRVAINTKCTSTPGSWFCNQTDRGQTNRQKDRQTDRYTHKHTSRKSNRQTRNEGKRVKEGMMARERVQIDLTSEVQ